MLSYRQGHLQVIKKCIIILCQLEGQSRNPYFRMVKVKEK